MTILGAALMGRAGLPEGLTNSGALNYLGKVIEAQALTLGYQDGFIMISVVFALALIPAWILGRSRSISAGAVSPTIAVPAGSSVRSDAGSSTSKPVHAAGAGQPFAFFTIGRHWSAMLSAFWRWAVERCAISLSRSRAADLSPARAERVSHMSAVTGSFLTPSPFM